VSLRAASGFEICGRLREGEPGRNWNRDMPVIMVSACGDPVDRVRGFARGADDYVVKPFVYEELNASTTSRCFMTRSGWWRTRERAFWLVPRR